VGYRKPVSRVYGIFSFWDLWLETLLIHQTAHMSATIPFYRKFLICFITGLVGAMTILRIATRLAFEAGVDPHRTPVPVIAAVPALIVFLTGLIYPFIWQSQGRSSNRQAGSGDPADPAKWVTMRFLLCYGIAIDLAMIGLQKWFGLQAHLHIALLDGPLSGFSGEDLSWAYFGRSPAFFNVIGGLQIAGSLLLVFRRTKLLGVFILLPVMTNICLMNYFYHFYPGELAQAVALLLGLLFLLLEEYGRLRSFFFPPDPQGSDPRPGIPGTLARLSVGYIPLLLITCFFHLPEKDPAHGKYKVTGLWIDDKPVNLENCGDSVLTTAYLDEGHDCLFEYNSRQRWLIGNYDLDRQAHQLQIIWHYPAHVHNTLVARVTDIPGGLGLDGRMGSAHIRMDWRKQW